MGPSPSPSPSDRTVIVGLSGPSSSGKTTLARLLRQVFNVSVSVPRTSDVDGGDEAKSGDSPSTSSSSPPRIKRWTVKLFILHEDDFYKTDKLIPRKEFTSQAFGTRTLEDWDCIESIDLPLLSSTLSHIKQHGVLPPEMVSKEDHNTVGASGVPDSKVEGFRSSLEAWVSSLQLQQQGFVSGFGGEENMNVTICVLDGFLLYPSPHSPENSQEREMLDMMNTSLDAKLFIPSTRAQTIDRRTKRTGYVTLEGFWEDPPGYVEDVVWVNYRKDHGWLFEGSKQGVPARNGSSDVRAEMNVEDEATWVAVDEGKVDREVAEANGISVGPGTGEVHLKDILPWAIDRLKQTVESKLV